MEKFLVWREERNSTLEVQRQGGKEKHSHLGAVVNIISVRDLLQVTRTFHQEHMPFSAQCYGFAGGGWREPRAGTNDNILQAPVRSEEIGADWGDVFQRLQVVPLQYSVPQVMIL